MLGDYLSITRYFIVDLLNPDVCLLGEQLPQKKIPSFFFNLPALGKDDCSE